WGWLNHTHVNGDPITDAKSVSYWIVQQSKNTTDSPAWIDYANYKDFVPSDVKKAGNEHFKNLKSGSIGKVIIAGTAAATWEVYYPNGLKKEYNGIQDYAPPIKVIIDTIQEWGGKISGDNGGSDPDPDPDPIPKPEVPEIKLDGILKYFKDFIDNLIEEIEKMLIVQLFDYGKSSVFGNSFLKVDKTFSNTYKIKPTLNFKKIIDDLVKSGNSEMAKLLSDTVDDISDLIGGIIDDIWSSNPDSDPDPDPDLVPDPENK